MYDNEYILEMNKYTMERLDMCEYLDKKIEENSKKDSGKKENTEV